MPGAADACGISPAKVPGTITVAATDITDARWAYSNYGTCVDVYAPGVQVRAHRCASGVPRWTSRAPGVWPSELTWQPLCTDPPGHMHASS